MEASLTEKQRQMTSSANEIHGILDDEHAILYST